MNGVTISGITRRELLRATGAGAAVYAAGPLISACRPSSDRRIKVGVLLPYSGIYAVLGESITKGMEMYLDEIDNEAGGREVELVTEDTELTPDVAQQKARKLVEQDEVDLVAGIVSTGVLYGLRDYFDTNKKLLICANAGGNKISRELKTPYIWRTSFSNWQPNWPLGRWARLSRPGRPRPAPWCARCVRTSPARAAARARSRRARTGPQPHRPCR